MLTLFSIPNKGADKDSIIKTLETEIECLTSSLEAITEKYENHKEILAKESRNGPFKINFHTMNAFSVERNLNDGIPVTIIGYKVIGQYGEETVREWYIHANDEAHADIVGDFEHYISTIDSRKKDNLF